VFIGAEFCHLFLSEKEQLEFALDVSEVVNLTAAPLLLGIIESCFRVFLKIVIG
jgi:hypothetical protein